MKIELIPQEQKDLESDSNRRQGRAAKRARRTGTKPPVKKNTAKRSPNATKRPGAEKKPTAKAPAKSTRKPSASKPAANKQTAKKKAPAKVPNSIEVLTQRSKPKLRVMYAEPGRYILNGRGVQYAIVRMKEETRYTPSMGKKLFQRRELESKSGTAEFNEELALLSSIGLGDYSEPEEALEAEYQASLESDSAKAPGSRNQTAGAKLGRKKRAPNMLAPGWHMLKMKDGKVTKEYVGPRMSARRLIDIAGGADTKGKDSKAKPTSKAEKATSLDRKVAGGFKKELESRDMDAKVQRSTKDGTMKITIDKGDRTKLTGALTQLKKQVGGKLEVTREMKGDKVIAVVKIADSKKKPAAKKDTSKKVNAKEKVKPTTRPKGKKAEPKKSTGGIDRKVATGFQKNLTERGIKDVKVRRNTKDGSIKVTIPKGDRTKLTGALTSLKKSIGGKLDVARKMVGDTVEAIIKPA